MNKHKLSKQLESIANNVAKKGIYVVIKHNDAFAIQEISSKKLVTVEMPMKGVAQYLCNFRNKGKRPNLTTEMKIERLAGQYFRCRTDMEFNRHTLKHTTDFTRYAVTEARMFDTMCKFDYTKEELKRFS